MFIIPFDIGDFFCETVKREKAKSLVIWKHLAFSVAVNYYLLINLFTLPNVYIQFTT